MTSPAQNPSVTLPNVLTFEGAELKIIDRDGQPWITSGDLGRALGYKRGGEHVASIYRQHAHEFSSDMTTTISLGEVAADFNADSPVRGNPNVPVRVFSPRGAHLIAMFSRTAKAAAFRRWVLDVLDGYARPAPVEESPLDALRLQRILFSLDGYGRPQATAIPDDAAVMRPADMHKWLDEPGVFTKDDVFKVALAAMRRLIEQGGHHAMRELLHTLDPNYLLVLESELIFSLYGSRVIYDGRGREVAHG